MKSLPVDKVLRKRFELVQENPDFWVEKLAHKFSARNVAIVSDYFRTEKNLREVGESYGISTERVRQILHTCTRYLDTIKKLVTPPPPKSELETIVTTFINGVEGYIEREVSKRLADKRVESAAVTLGRMGGKIGGDARAAKLSPDQRMEIALKAKKEDFEEFLKKENGETQYAK